MEYTPPRITRQEVIRLADTEARLGRHDQARDHFTEAIGSMGSGGPDGGRDIAKRHRGDDGERTARAVAAQHQSGD